MMLLLINDASSEIRSFTKDATSSGLPYLPTMVARLIQCAVMAALQLVLIPLIVKTIQTIEKRYPT